MSQLKDYEITLHGETVGFVIATGPSMAKWIYAKQAHSNGYFSRCYRAKENN